MRAGLHRALKRLSWVVGVLLVVSVVTIFAAVSTAKVVSTSSGVDVGLRIPIHYKDKSIALRTFAGTGKNVLIKDYLAGPIVHRGASGHWSAKWFCQNQRHHKSGNTATLTIDCAGKQHVFTLDEAPIPPAVAPMPDKLVVLSDLEGNRRFLESALLELGVVDHTGRWQFGHGELVILGDSVDRGRDVFAVLWRLHDLSKQAHAAGGAVHVVLGNHDQYLLRGNTTRAHPEYRYALQQLGGYKPAFAADTVLGAWLRKLPVALKLGSVLFVHGGVSPRVAKSDLSVAQLNKTMREYWHHEGKATRSAARDAVLTLTGVTQYRGYFYAIDGKYATATKRDVANALAHFDATQIVVAHTKVDKVKRLFGGRVYAVDVNEDEAGSGVLVYEHGVAHVVNTGIRRKLDTKPPLEQREFSVFNRADREMLVALFAEGRRLSAMPRPY